MRRQAATLDEVRKWPALVSLKRAGEALGIATATAYDLFNRSEFPVPVVKVGSVRKVRTSDLLAFMGGAQ